MRRKTVKLNADVQKVMKNILYASQIVSFFGNWAGQEAAPVRYAEKAEACAADIDKDVLKLWPAGKETKKAALEALKRAKASSKDKILKIFENL